MAVRRQLDRVLGHHTGRMPPILIQGETGKSVERLGQFQIRQTQGWHLGLLARDPSEGAPGPAHPG